MEEDRFSLRQVSIIKWQGFKRSLNTSFALVFQREVHRSEPVSLVSQAAVEPSGVWRVELPGGRRLYSVYCVYSRSSNINRSIDVLIGSWLQTMSHRAKLYAEIRAERVHALLLSLCRLLSTPHYYYYYSITENSAIIILHATKHQFPKIYLSTRRC